MFAYRGSMSDFSAAINTKKREPLRESTKCIWALTKTIQIKEKARNPKKQQNDWY